MEQALVKTSLHNLTSKVLSVIAPNLHQHILDNHASTHMLVQALQEFQEAVVDNINPKKLYQEIIHIFKKYGLKIGILVTLIELVDHFGLPILFCFLGWYKVAAVVTALPVSEIFIYPGVLLLIRRYYGKKR